ncbi:MAG: hydratase [Shewanella sp.]
MAQSVNPFTPATLAAAAKELAERRASGQCGALLADSLRPQSFAQAFAIQQAVAKVFQAANNPIAGWKCLLPKGDTLIVAPIYQQDVYQQTPRCPLMQSASGLARVEPELAFEIAQDLPPSPAPYSQEAIDSALGHTHLALELIHSRYLEPSKADFFDALADGLVNQGLWLGPIIAQATDTREFALKVNIEGAEPLHLAASHPNGAATAGLYWLVNFLSAQGIGLTRGQYVITGSYAGVLELPLGQRCEFHYGSLGQFQVEFVAKAPNL